MGRVDLNILFNGKKLPKNLDRVIDKYANYRSGRN
jgi:hypothetical protein